MEILPYKVTKGEAIQKIWLSLCFVGYFPLYLGDDMTDESVFAVIQEQGLSFKVGDEEQPTKATHFLKDPAQVQEFLALLATQGKRKRENYSRSAGRKSLLVPGMFSDAMPIPIIFSSPARFGTFLP